MLTNSTLPQLLVITTLLSLGCSERTREPRNIPTPEGHDDDTGVAEGRDDTARPDSGGGTGDSDTGDSDTGDSDTGSSDSGSVSDGVGSCDAWDAPIIIANVLDGSLSELSDLVPSRVNPGVLWAHNDSGGEPVLYAIEGATGGLLGTLRVEGVRNHDWEDIAVAPCPDGGGDCVFVGDAGDNGLSRDDVAVLVVPEPVLDGAVTDRIFDVAVAPTIYRFDYPRGRNNVEGLAVGPDGLPVLVTKRVDATADVYRFPTMDASRTVTVDLVARIDTGDPANEHAAEATGADVSPDGTRLLVRTYDHLLEYPLTDGFPGIPVSLPAPHEPQGEAAAYDPASGGIWLTSEGRHQPLWFVACLAPRGL